MAHFYYDVTLTCTTKGLNAYDVIADTQTMGNTEGGYLHSLELWNLDDTDEGIDIFFLRSNTSIGTEGSSMSMTDAEALEILTKVEFSSGSWTSAVNNLFQIKTATAGDGGMGAYLVNAASATSALIYVGAAMRGSTGVFTTGGLRLRVGMVN